MENRWYPDKEKPIFQTNYLKGVFEIDNQRQLPLRVAIQLHSNQLISNFDFKEFYVWLEIIKNSISFFRGTERDQNFENLLRPKINQSTANEYMSKIRHKKSKSEPPLKFNYTNKPCIEFCLEAKAGFQIVMALWVITYGEPIIEHQFESLWKLYGCQLQLNSTDSVILLTLNSVNVAHHKQTDTQVAFQYRWFVVTLSV